VVETGERAREARSAMNYLANNILREKVTLAVVILVLVAIDTFFAYRLCTNKGKLF
jgi:hypothetical protein